MLGKTFRIHRSFALTGLESQVLPHNFCTPEQFGRQFSLEKRRVERLHTPFSIVIISLKKLAHPPRRRSGCGSDAIHRLAGIICSTLRETDGVSVRGEKVISIIMPDTDLAGAHCACQRVLARLAQPAGLIPPEFCREDLMIEAISYPENPVPENLEKCEQENQQDFPGQAQTTLKRIMDITGAAAGLILFAPVMGVIALLIKLTSRGPVLFRQTRLGYEGREFVFLKFRSMREGCNDGMHRDYVHKLILGKTEEINNGSKETPLYKITHDPRITPLGRFLRRTSLDELPQFWNVLKGDMSLVGPRPAIPYELEAYKAWHFRRLQKVKPGITGLWQVTGRNRTTFDEMARLDICYTKNWSILLDLKILLKTTKVFMQANGS